MHWLPMLPDHRSRHTSSSILFNLCVTGLVAFLLSTAVAPLREDGAVMAHAATPASVDVDYAVTTQDLNQTWPVAVFNQNTGEYLVAYEHDVSTSDANVDIYARRIERDGSPAEDAFGVVTTGWQELHPDAAVNTTSGEYLVVWEHVVSSGDHTIKAQRVRSTGSLVEINFPIAWTTSYKAYPAVAYNAALDEYLVVWEQANIDTNVIRGQRVDANGALLGSVIPVGAASPSLSSGLLPYQPDVAWDSANDQYLVVWAKYTGSEYNIVGQRVDGDGTLSGGELTIENWQYDQIKPKVVYNSYSDDEEFMVVWEDRHWANGAARDIYGRRVGSGGAVYSRFGVAWGPDDSHDRVNPAIAYKASTREIMVSWENAYALPLGLTGRDIYRRRLDYLGALLEDEQVVIATGNFEQLPTIAADDADHYLVAWEDSRNLPTTAFDIYAALPATGLFSGHVYNGTAWEGAVALPGAQVKLYCSNSLDNLGTLLETTTADGTGAYHLTVVNTCEVWHLVETPPAGYDPVDARPGAGGTRVSATHLRYVYPLDSSKTLSGNDFLNTLHTATDTIPPTGWANFTPAGWVNQQSATTTIQVQDTGSGLNVGSAEYAYSTDGGATWAEWRSAICSGSNDTKEPQTITAENVPFGQDSGSGNLNRIKFRIWDTAATPNLGTSPVYSVAIDATAPPKPTGLKSTSHQTSVWSKDNTVDAAWNAVADAGSGLAGYSVEWSKATNTTPDSFLDSTSPAFTSSALENSDLWYIHVRAKDNAGNLSTTTHLGPFYIDTLAPLTSVSFLDPHQGSLNFSVSWTEATTYGSPLTGFDIKVVETWDGGSKTTTWQSNTLLTSATYPGVRGHTYAFYSRGRDAAGNQGAYPSTPDATTTVGKDLTVTVVDEAGKRVTDAQAFFNGSFVDLTNAYGEWVAEDVLVGDQMAARYRVFTQPATKPDHFRILPDLGGAEYGAWHVYITSVGFDAVGNPHVYQVANLDQSPTLILRKSQALVGIRFLVSVEWDADPAYLADLKQGLHNASAYLYDITDGQMLFDGAVVWDSHAYWGASDMQVHATNHLTPHAFPNGITWGTTKHIHMGRFYNGSTSNSGQWQNLRAFRTLIHEFGHYGLHLYDEYLDADGDRSADAYCTTNFNKSIVVDDSQASLMYMESLATEMCSTVDPNHTHRTNTEQHAEHGECTWTTVQKKFDDNNQNDRWLILTPMDRGTIMPGPTAIPVADWSRVYVHDMDTGVCAPFKVTIDMSRRLGGSAPTGADVFVIPKSAGSPSLYQGRPDAAGDITIFGAHDGDSLSVVLFGFSSISTWPSMISTMTVQETIHCATKAGAATVELLVPVPDAFSLMVNAAPIAGDRVYIQVEPTTALSTPPTVELWQTGGITPTHVTMTLQANTTTYVGDAQLDTSLQPGGMIYVKARDTHEDEVWTIHQFAFTPVEAGDQTSQIYSTDGMARLALRADSLSADAVVVIETAPGGDPGDLALVSGPYQVGTGAVPLAGDATVHMTYMSGAAASVQPDSLRLVRLDAESGDWVAQASTHDAALRLVSARVDELGVFAVLGQPLRAGRLHLPLAVRGETAAVAGTERPAVHFHQYLPSTCCAQSHPTPQSMLKPPVVDAHRDLTHMTYLPLVR